MCVSCLLLVCPTLSPFNEIRKSLTRQDLTIETRNFQTFFYFIFYLYFGKLITQVVKTKSDSKSNIKLTSRVDIVIYGWRDSHLLCSYLKGTKDVCFNIGFNHRKIFRLLHTACAV